MLAFGGKAAQELEVARGTLEHAVLLALELRDSAAFDRNFAQLQPYYTDFKTQIPASQNEALLTGLHLIRLLADGRMAEFHSALELVPEKLYNDTTIRFPVQVRSTYNQRCNEPKPISIMNHPPTYVLTYLPIPSPCRSSNG